MTNCSWGYFKVVFISLLFGWLYKTGNTVQYLFYYIFLKKKSILPVIQAEFVFIYCVRECIR